MVFALIAGVFAFGWVAFLYGLWQVATGRRNLVAVGLLLAIAGALYFAGVAFTRGSGP